MAEKKPSSREQVKQIVASIEDNIQKIFQSEQYADYLRTMSRFHSYSYNNTILIHMQMPNATQVAGFNKWKNQFGRHVKKGEKGLTIIAPTPFKKKIEEMKLDPDTRAPVLDIDGNVVMEEREIEIPLFRPVKVFDVSQTEGRPLPSLVSSLTGDVQQYEAFMEALRRTSPVPVQFKPLRKGLDGLFSSKDQTITIREGMSQVQTVCAVVHEITHAMLHNRERDQITAVAGNTDKEPPKPKDKNTMEVEAESVSYTVCQYYGIETGTNSLGYIATWSGDKTLPELKASLETISKTANALITGIDRHFAEICKERGIDLTAQQPEVPTPETPSAPEAGTSQDRLDGLAQEQEQEYKYVVEYESNIRQFLLSAYQKDGSSKLGLAMFAGDEATCNHLLDKLRAGTLHYDNFCTVLTARVSHYTAKDGAELVALVDENDKVYLGRREHYDHWGHYLNSDNSLLHISDNGKMFDFISGGGYSISQADLVAQGALSQEDFAEFDALRVGVLAQFEQEEPLLFAGEPFQFVQQEPPEIPYTDQQEAVYLLDDSVYLHIQASDEGWDYTLHTKHDMAQLDGGQLEARSMADVVEYIRKTEEIGTLAIALAPLEVLDELRDASDHAVQAAVEDIQDRRRDLRDELLEHFAQEDAALWDTTLDEYPMPDPLCTVSDLESNWGYLDGDLLPLTKNRAAELVEQDFSIYAIVDGGQAEMLFDADDLAELPVDGMFAVSRDEWETSQDFRQAVLDRMEHQPDREKAFLDHAADCFAIYQVRDDDTLRDIRFESLDWLKSIGRTVERENYDLVYTAPLPASGSVDAALDQLWYQFNNEHPADFQHPSMSVSDIIALKRDGVVSCHYCDSFGFQQLADFLAQKPTVADLEAQAMAGQTISLMELADATHREAREKKSVVAQLKNQPQPGRNKTAPKKSAEMEI